MVQHAKNKRCHMSVLHFIASLSLSPSLSIIGTSRLKAGRTQWLIFQSFFFNRKKKTFHPVISDCGQDVLYIHKYIDFSDLIVLCVF